MEKPSETKISILRLKAEEQLRKMQLTPNSIQPEIDPLILNHELEVLQIEIEMQCDELLREKELRKNVTDKYNELYEMEPAGHFKLTKNGDIADLNIYGSKLLGKERRYLRGSRFGFFVTDECKPVFSQFLDNAFVKRVNDSCILNMILDGNIIKQVVLTSNITKDGEHCLIAAIDIPLHDQTETKPKESFEFNDYFVCREIKMGELKKEINELLQKTGSEKRY
jgi:hypothetical protein